MAGIGRFKLTDALPQEAPAQETEPKGGAPGASWSKRTKGKAKAKGGPGAGGGKSTGAKGLSAEQLREARESSQARNAEASTRDRMVEIGRGNQQAGRQRSSGK